MSSVMNRTQKTKILQDALRSKDPKALDELVVLKPLNGSAGQYYDPATKNKFTITQLQGKVEEKAVGQFTKEK